MDVEGIGFESSEPHQELTYLSLIEVLSMNELGNSRATIHEVPELSITDFCAHIVSHLASEKGLKYALE